MSKVIQCQGQILGHPKGYGGLKTLDLRELHLTPLFHVFYH